MTMENCDMCGSKIENNKCDCGTWYKDTNSHPIRLAIETFHKMDKFAITTDAPHLGCAAVFFRGDYLDCMKVQQFIYKMKGRPHYED